MILSHQQNEAFCALQSFIVSDSHVFILKGYAGTGKTTMIKVVADYIREQKLTPQMMAPTGRAAKILRSKLQGYDVTTIHKAIYVLERLISDEETGEFKYIFPLKNNDERKIFIVDESSMISSNKANSELFQFGSGVLMDDILTFAKLHRGSKIIFVGDPMQLAPVGDNKSVALEESYFAEKGLKVNSIELTDVVRQNADSAILENATILRNIKRLNIKNEQTLKYKAGDFEKIDAIDIPQHYVKENNAAIVCFTNKLAQTYNTQIRNILFPNKKEICAGDKLMIVRNNYYNGIELFNGDIITVLDVSNETVTQSANIKTEIAGELKTIPISLEYRMIIFKTESGDIISQNVVETLLNSIETSLSVDQHKSMYANFVIRANYKGFKDRKSEEFLNALRQDKYYNALNVKYGYAFTCHKAQGGEWENVYVDFDGRKGFNSDALRWRYTAITRGKNTVYSTNIEDINPFSKINIASIQKISKINPNAIAIAEINVEETPFHNGETLSAVKEKYWSIFRNLENTEYKIQKVSSKLYREVYEINTPQGISRIDCLYNGKGVFTKYENKDNKTDVVFIEEYFKKETTIKSELNYTPSTTLLETLFKHIKSVCNEYDIDITNIVETPGNYIVSYYLKTSGKFSSIAFNFDNKGFISYAAPLSELGTDDMKLKQLISTLKQ